MKYSIDTAQLAAMQDFQSITGVPIEKQIFEAIADHIECCLSSRVEALAEKTAQA
jgi:hypothetical protein